MDAVVVGFGLAVVAVGVLLKVLLERRRRQLAERPGPIPMRFTLWWAWIFFGVLGLVADDRR